jgi:predicted GIY-YIG superfamily endonuclease
MAKFFYVYILETEDAQHHYVGLTEDLRKRVEDHQQGRSPHFAVRALATQDLHRFL